MKKKISLFIIIYLAIISIFIFLIITKESRKKIKHYNINKIKKLRLKEFRKISIANNKIKMPTKFTISYSYGGGYTYYSRSLTRKISVDQDGKVKLELDIDNPRVEPMEYKVDKEKAIKLMKYFYNNKFYNLNDISLDFYVTDYITSYLEVKSDTFNKKIGGYAANLHKDFHMFVKEFDIIKNLEIETIFDEKVDESYRFMNN